MYDETISFLHHFKKGISSKLDSIEKKTKTVGYFKPALYFCLKKQKNLKNYLEKVHSLELDLNYT